MAYFGSIRSILLLGVVAFAVGCGGEDEEPLNPLSNANGQLAGAALVTSLDQTLSGFEMNGLATSFAQASCYTISGSLDDFGQPRDTDGDSIYDDIRVDADCEIVDEQDGTTIGIRGGIYVRDTDSTGPSFSFVNGVDNLVVTITSVDQNMSAREHGTMTASVNGGTYTVSETMAVTLTATQPQQQYISMNTNWSVAYTPTGAWTPGDDLTSGTLDVQGSWSVRIDDEGASTSVTTNPALTLDDTACFGNAPIVSGGLQADWQNGAEQASIDVAWTDCDTYSVSVVGGV